MLYHLVSFIFLISGLVSMNRVSFEQFAIMCFIAVGFAIAGSITDIGESINSILEFKKNMLKAGTEALKNFNKMLNKDKQDDDNDEEN
mgnify:CR=1 FL=1